MNTFLFAAADGATPAASAPAAPAAQPAPATTETQITGATDTQAIEVQPAEKNTTTAPQQQQSSGFGMFWPMLIIFAIFYFMMIRPQQRKEKERRKMIQEMRAGTKVVFAGGLIGKIVEAKERTFMIEIAGDVVVEVARNAVQGPVEEDKPADGSAK